MKNLKIVFGFTIIFIILANAIGANISISKITCKGLCRLTCISSTQLDFCIDVCMKRCTIHSVYEAMINNTSCYEQCSNTFSGIIFILYIPYNFLIKKDSY